MTDPYLFERGIGQQIGDLCRLAVGDAKVTQTGEIVTLEDMLGRGAFGVSVEVPYTSGGVQSVTVTRCGKNLLGGETLARAIVANRDDATVDTVGKTVYWIGGSNMGTMFSRFKEGIYYTFIGKIAASFSFINLSFANANNVYEAYGQWNVSNKPIGYDFIHKSAFPPTYFRTRSISGITALFYDNCGLFEGDVQLDDFEPYNGNTYTITLPADFYGGAIDLEASTITSRYAADGTELAEPVITEIDPISIPILAGVNNIWAGVGTVTVSYYAADAETFRPALWYPTIYRGLTSARYLIKRASGAIASFDDAVAAPLVGLRVALPWRSEGYHAVAVTVNSDIYTTTLPTTIYGGYLDVVTGQLVATHDENGNLLTNQKLYFLPPTNINALAGVNNVWSDAGDVAVSYRIDND